MPGTEDDDLRLLAASPCIEAGDPGLVIEFGETDLDGHPRVMGCRVDMGAYEFVTGDPGSGDLDGDGVIEYDDLVIFIQGLLEGSNLVACVSDLNGDDRGDGLDIQLFTALLLAGG